MRLVLEEAVTDWTTPSFAQDPQSAVVTRHGFVTDGDHSYFRVGTLLATCAFSSRMTSWAPVLYTWVLRLDTEHHRVHFRNLIKAIIVAAGIRFERKMLLNVSLLSPSVWFFLN